MDRRVGFADPSVRGGGGGSLEQNFLHVRSYQVTPWDGRPAEVLGGEAERALE